MPYPSWEEEAEGWVTLAIVLGVGSAVGGAIAFLLLALIRATV